MDWERQGEWAQIEREVGGRGAGGGHGRGSKRAVKGRFPEKLRKKHGILLKKLGVKIFLSIFAP
jgi:hypothetical protein